MQGLKRRVRETLKRLGYVVSRAPEQAFPELLSTPRYIERTVNLAGHPFRLADAPSFLASYAEIFVEEIYRFPNGSEAPRIIDCGGNCGVSVMYFKKTYPNANLRVVEADPRIFEILRANVQAARLSNIELINKAVADKPGMLKFYSEGADGGRTHHLSLPSGVTLVPAVTLDELIDGHVDFLKIDIEGAETSALLACSNLSQVDRMFIEYHSFEDTDQSLSDMLLKLRETGFRYYIRTQICSRRPLTEKLVHMGMDMQLNIFAVKQASGLR